VKTTRNGKIFPHASCSILGSSDQADDDGNHRETFQWTVKSTINGILFRK